MQGAMTRDSAVTIIVNVTLDGLAIIVRLKSYVTHFVSTVSAVTIVTWTVTTLLASAPRAFLGDCSISLGDGACVPECVMGVCNGDGSGCLCVHGWEGDACDHETEFCTNNELPCGDHGVCGNGVCWCAENWTGERCEELDQEAVFSCEESCTDGQGACIDAVCVCYPGFTGSLCSDIEECTDDADGDFPCSGHGVCEMGICHCFPGYAGSLFRLYQDDLIAADSLSCIDECNNNGVCFLGECHCLNGFWGEACGAHEPYICPFNCNERGECVSGQCHCDLGYIGVGCEQEKHCSELCLLHGVCAHGTCFCTAGWKGKDCDEAMKQGERTHQLQEDLEVAVLKVDKAGPCGPGCGIHGICGPDGSCMCEDGVTDMNCTQSIDESSVSCDGCVLSHGECLFGKCFCHYGWSGDSCEGAISALCPSNCNHRGLCLHGQCYCDDGYGGLACVRLHACEYACGPHGACINGDCVCALGYNGSMCTGLTGEEPLPDPDDYEVFGFQSDVQGVNTNTAKLPSNTPVVTLQKDARAVVECREGCGSGTCHKNTCYCRAGTTGHSCNITLKNNAVDVASGTRPATATEHPGGVYTYMYAHHDDISLRASSSAVTLFSFVAAFVVGMFMVAALMHMNSNSDSGSDNAPRAIAGGAGSGEKTLPRV